MFSPDSTGTLAAASSLEKPLRESLKTGADTAAASEVGKLVAEELLNGESALLQPFRFSRYERGELHPVSHSPFPWS